MAPPDRPLSRRRLLSLVGTSLVGLAGCQNPSGSTGTAATTRPPTTSRSAPETASATEPGTEQTPRTRPATPGEDDWPMFQADASNSGHHTSSSGPGAALTERWSYRTGSRTVLARQGETVYAVQPTGGLTALDLSDGSVLWARGEDGYRWPPVELGDRLFVPWRGALRSLEPEDGELAWTSAPFDRPITSRLTVVDGTLVYAKPSGQVEAFDPEAGQVRWRRDTGATIIAHLHAHDGTVYLGNDRGAGVLFALDPSDGSVRWTFETASPSPGIPSTPVASDGVVFVGNDGGWAHAVDAVTGRERWRTRVGGPVHTQPAIQGDRLYLGLRGFPSGFVKALDRGTGDEQWSVTFEGTEWQSSEVWSTPVLVGSTLFVGSDNGRLYGLDPSDGTVRWHLETDRKVRSLAETDDGVCLANFGSETYRVTTGGAEEWRHIGDGVPLRSPPVVGGGTIFFGGMDAAIHAVREADGRRRWVQQTERQVSSGGAVSEGTLYFQAVKTGAFDAASGALQWGFRPVASGATAPVYADGVLYVCESSGIVERTVYAVDVAEGSMRWEQETDEELIASPALGEGVLCSGGRGGVVYGFEADTGAVRWRHRTGGDVVAGPTVAGDTVYVGDRDGNLYALSLQDGSEHLHYRLGEPVTASPAYAGDTLYIPTPQSVTAFEPTSQRERWRASIGSMAAPSVDDDYVYIGDVEGQVRALDVQSGREVAAFNTGQGRIRSAPAVVNGTVYVGGPDGSLYALAAPRAAE